MDIEKLKRDLITKKIFDLKLKATYYDRPINADEESKKCYFENLIKCEKKWKYVNGYNDDMGSGDNFLKLIKDSRDNIFDLVVLDKMDNIPDNELGRGFLYQEHIQCVSLSIICKINKETLPPLDEISLTDEDIEWKILVLETSRIRPNDRLKNITLKGESYASKYTNWRRFN